MDCLEIQVGPTQIAHRLENYRRLASAESLPEMIFQGGNRSKSSQLGLKRTPPDQLHPNHVRIMRAVAPGIELLLNRRLDALERSNRRKLHFEPVPANGIDREKPAVRPTRGCGGLAGCRGRRRLRLRAAGIRLGCAHVREPSSPSCGWPSLRRCRARNFRSEERRVGKK